jgi:CBS domain-containing protein
MKTISEVMTRGAECVAPSATIQEAAQKMKDLNAGPLPVCEGDRRGGAGESSPGRPIIAPGVSAPLQGAPPVAPGSSGGARGGGGSGMSYRTGQGPGPGFVKK